MAHIKDDRVTGVVKRQETFRFDGPPPRWEIRYREPWNFPEDWVLFRGYDPLTGTEKLSYEDYGEAVAKCHRQSIMYTEADWTVVQMGVPHDSPKPFQPVWGKIDEPPVLTTSSTHYAAEPFVSYTFQSPVDVLMPDGAW